MQNNCIEPYKNLQYYSCLSTQCD